MSKQAKVYRMVKDDHICPYGIKTVDLLKRQGFEVEDNHLASRRETDAFKEKHGVETTPQTFQYDPDLVFGREVPTGPAANILHNLLGRLVRL